MRGKTFSGAHMWFYFVACSLCYWTASWRRIVSNPFGRRMGWCPASSLVSQSVESVRDVVCGASMLVWWRRKWLMLSSGAVERRIRRSINAWQLRLYWWSLWRRRGAEREAVIRSDHFCVFVKDLSSESVLRQALIERDKTKKKNRKCDPDVKSPSDPIRDSSQDRTGDYNDCWIKMRTANFCFAWKVDKLLCKISTDFHLRTVFSDTWKCLFTTRAAVLKCSVCSCSTLKRREDPLLNAK